MGPTKLSLSITETKHHNTNLKDHLTQRVLPLTVLKMGVPIKKIVYRIKYEIMYEAIVNDRLKTVLNLHTNTNIRSRAKKAKT